MPINFPIDHSHTPKNYGFIIDNRKCIGCHACSTACKAENEVPLGVYRTWVKYVDTGVFPNTRRHFQVTRCNHCANPPCVRICPTEAMVQRDDGIVEFDSSVCIGCKACMQACPYDAIYIDPETNTAAKCHYCAHRTDIGLEPACVVVCPEHAIIAGDMNDPNSEISHLLATQDVTVRKPEQGTAPKLFYIDGNSVTLHPTAVDRAPETFMWADVIAGEQRSEGAEEKGRLEIGDWRVGDREGQRSAVSGRPSAVGGRQGLPWNGPIHIGMSQAEHMVQVAYNAQHKVPWHWPVPAYLVTKGIGAGIFILLSLGWGLGLFPFDGLTAVVGGFLSLLFIGLTTALLVYDLERPERFLYILLRPQWKSWLTRGAVALIGFTVVVGLWWLLETIAYFSGPDEMTATVTQSGDVSVVMIPIGLNNALTVVRPLLLWLGLPLAILVAIYTAFLFAQAEGRDLWQSPLLPFHLIVQSFVAGSGLLLILDLFLPIPESIIRVAMLAFIVALVIDLFVTLVGEFSIPHASEVAARAAHEIRSGRYRNYFWWGSIGLGHGVALGLAAVAWLLGGAIWGALAGLFAIVGLYLFEYAFVMAPQEIPNS
jgi:Fe-S-cluster-containing dehydrogenase component/formate-dependent nitrite reductase membrane component NrfD